MASNDASSEPASGRPSLRRSALLVGAFVLLLWLIWLADVSLGLDLVRFGVHPRHLSGLVGVLVGPLIHASAAHLFANTAPLLVLASALLYGYPRSARIVRRDRLALALSLIVFFLYGGMIWGIFPREPGISFESHLFGALLGVVLAFLLRNRDPRPPERRYSWEDDVEDTTDPAIGGAWRPPGHSGDREAG